MPQCGQALRAHNELPPAERINEFPLVVGLGLLDLRAGIGLDRRVYSLDAWGVIIDFHTHIFPPNVREQREEYARRDPTFAEMYVASAAKIATAEELLASMDEAGVDLSVGLGFAWQDHDDIVRHNDYLLESAARSGGRIVPFATVNMAAAAAEAEIQRCAKAGALGLGELRPENQGWVLNGDEGRALGEIARNLRLILLFHVTEPGERTYPGRRGLESSEFREFVSQNQDLRVVGAHLGGGYYTQKGLRAAPYVDTAAVPFLHPGNEAIDALKRLPGHRILFGSDFPLVSQKRALAELRRDAPADCIDGALRENARELLDI